MITKSVSRNRKAAGGPSKAAKAKKSRKVVEKRAAERTQFFAAATLYKDLNPDNAHKVWVTNISLGGMSFYTRREYAPADIYHVRMEAGPIRLNCPVLIIWIREKEAGISEVGCEFIPD
jgi:hypothetical protein